ncbi:MAG: hypothetical protein IPJ71_00500 [Bdellovibrionales bacterium]|nr:hypothetical protein [Bdellovibrionales bacterium]
MRMDLLCKVLMRVLGAAIVATGLVFQAQTSSGEEGSGKNVLAPPVFEKGEGERAEIYEEICRKPAVGEHYRTCVIETNKVSAEAGAVILSTQGSSAEGISGGAQGGTFAEGFGADLNSIAADICVAEGRKCFIGCREAKMTLLKFLSEARSRVPTQSSALMQIQLNIGRAEKGMGICRKYFGEKVAALGGNADILNSAASRSAKVADVTKSGAGGGAGGALSEGGGSSKFDQLGGGSGSTQQNDSSGGSSMSPWLVGGIGAAVGGIAGYMFGKNTGEEVGYEEGKKDAEEAAKKEEEDKDGDGSADCAKAESATKTECKGTFYAKCDKDPAAEGCSDFADSYCKTTDPVPDAAFCRKMSAANYCSKSDSINKGNCMSCREISSGFTGQYSPEDLANSCAVCSGDPLCSTNGSYFAYRAAFGSTNLAGGNSLSPNLPATAGTGSGGAGPGGVPPGSGGTGNTGGGTAGSGPFGQSLTGGGSLAGGTMQVQNSGPNQYRISSSHGQSNFRVHSSIIQRFCQQGSMVGCGPLAGVSGARGVSSSASEVEGSVGAGAQ